MITNADITIFNKRYVREERTEKFVGTQIKGVSFYSRKGRTSGNQERDDKDTYTIRIPDTADTTGKAYAEQMEYSGMDDEIYPGYWTIQRGDIVVRGLSDLEVATETELKQSYPDVVTVTNFTDNRSRCSNYMKHWRIGGE